MGTRADFYRGGTDPSQMVWLGSIAWDGYPSGYPEHVVKATTEEEYLSAVEDLKALDHWTSPEDGWPWPWEDSNTTDYAYTFTDGEVLGNSFGHGWFVASEQDYDADAPDQKPTPYPKMDDRMNVKHSGPGSGLIVVTHDADGTHVE